MDEKIAIVFVGPPGSGKGTQAKLLVEKHGFHHYDMGFYLRQIIDGGGTDPLILKIRQIVERGDLLPDDILGEAFEKMVHDAADQQAIIIDGIPRRVGQVDQVVSALARNDFKRTIFLYLNVSEKTATERLIARAARKDDAPDVVPTRIKNYKEITYPAVEYARQQGLRLIEIDGEPSVENVERAISIAIK